MHAFRLYRRCCCRRRSRHHKAANRGSYCEIRREGRATLMRQSRYSSDPSRSEGLRGIRYIDFCCQPLSLLISEGAYTHFRGSARIWRPVIHRFHLLPQQTRCLRQWAFHFDVYSSRAEFVYFFPLAYKRTGHITCLLMALETFLLYIYIYSHDWAGIWIYASYEAFSSNTTFASPTCKSLREYIAYLVRTENDFQLINLSQWYQKDSCLRIIPCIGNVHSNFIRI